MPEQLAIGRVSIMAVPDTGVTGSPSFMFPQIEAERWAQWKQDFPQYFNPRGNLRMNIGTFVVRSAGKLILIDTGLGDKPREGYPPGNLLGNLASAGVSPDDVDLVVITHLHIDHVGWNTASRDGAWAPTFPRARYLIARREWEYFSQPEQAQKLEYMQDSVLPLAGSGQLDLVEETHAVTADLTLVPAPGHTPAHVCVAIVSDGARAMIIGDMAHHPVQLTETDWSVAFDLDPKLAAETRARMVERMEREDAVVIGGHFPSPGIGRLVRLGERRVWRATV